MSGAKNMFSHNMVTLIILFDEFYSLWMEVVECLPTDLIHIYFVANLLPVILDKFQRYK